MYLLTSLTLLAICSFVMFSFDGASSRRIARSSFYSISNECGDQEVRGFSQDHPMLDSEIRTMQVVRVLLGFFVQLFYPSPYHEGVLATLDNGVKVLIHKVFFRLFVLFSKRACTCTHSCYLINICFRSDV